MALACAAAIVARFVGQMNQLHQVEGGTAFARPHDMDLSLDLPSGQELEVHLTRPRLEELQLAEGQRVYVRPNRVQVLAGDYIIWGAQFF